MLIAPLQITLIASFVRFVQPNRLEREGRTAIAIKQGIQDYNNSIPVGISDFKELTRKSKIFIDNTLFCNEILYIKPRKKLTIIGPSQWGKSTLLSMLKHYLEIEVDEQGNEILPRESRTNYRLFNNGEIVHDDGRVEKLRTPLLTASQEVCMDSFQGKFPVIYLSFTHAIGKDYGEIERNISLAFHKAFKQHEYFIEIFERKIKANTSSHSREESQRNLEEFKKYLRTTEQLQFKLSDFYECFKFFARILKDHFGRRCYLLIDDYDKPIHSSATFEQFTEKDEQKMFVEFNYLQKILARVTDHEYRGIFFTQTISIAFDEFEFFEIEHMLYEDTHGSIPSLREYFGFKEQHVEFLYKQHHINTQQAQTAKKWYNGFQTSVSKQHFYNPASIVQFLSRRQFICYRPEQRFNYFIQKILRKKVMARNHILSLISKGEEELTFTYHTPNREQYLYISSRPWFPSVINSIELLDAILRIENYVTPVLELGKNYYRVANNEAAFMMSTWMISHYKREYQLCDTTLDQAAKALRDCITSQRNTDSLKASLEHLYKASVLQVSQTKNGFAGICDSSARMILNCVALQMQCQSAFEIDVYYKPTKKADLVIHHEEKKKLVIVELCHSHLTEKSTPNLVNKYAEVLRSFSHLSEAQLLEIDFSRNETLGISFQSLTKIN